MSMMSIIRDMSLIERVRWPGINNGYNCFSRNAQLPVNYLLKDSQRNVHTPYSLNANRIKVRLSFSVLRATD